MNLNKDEKVTLLAKTGGFMLATAALIAVCEGLNALTSDKVLSFVCGFSISIGVLLLGTKILVRFLDKRL